MPAPYKSIAIANQFIVSLPVRGISDVTHMKLQKLVFFAHAWHLAIAGKPLITEKVQAWKYGPVIPDLYRELKQYGDCVVKNLVTDYDFTGEITLITPMVDHSDAFVLDLLSQVIGIYGKYTSIQLSNLSHVEGDPWARTIREAGGFSEDLEIDDRLIEEIFKGKLNKK